MPTCAVPAKSQPYVQSGTGEALVYFLRTTDACGVPKLIVWIATFVFVASAEATCWFSEPTEVASDQIAVGGFESLTEKSSVASLFSVYSVKTSLPLLPIETELPIHARPPSGWLQMRPLGVSGFGPPRSSDETATLRMNAPCGVTSRRRAPGSAVVPCCPVGAARTRGGRGR
jgi:hypothetical protein